MLTTALKELSIAQIDLANKGGPEWDNALFEDVLSRQDNLLKNFELPQTTVYEQLLQFETLPNKQILEDRMNQLKVAATIYLLSKAKTERTLLLEAQERGLNAFDVLPELGVLTHTYTLFIYNYILLKEKDSIENILQEFKLLRNQDLLHWVGILAQATQQEEEAVYDPLAAWPGDQTITVTLEGEESYMCCAELAELLKVKGLRYLNPFLLSLTNLLNDEDKYD